MNSKKLIFLLLVQSVALNAMQSNPNYHSAIFALIRETNGQQALREASIPKKESMLQQNHIATQMKKQTGNLLNAYFQGLNGSQQSNRTPGRELVFQNNNISRSQSMSDLSLGQPAIVETFIGKRSLRK